METWDALTARRNVRSYTDEPIAAADLDRILEAGRRSPSASNRQKWDFVVVTDRSQLSELGTVWQGARHVPGSAAAIVLVLPAPESERYRLIDQYDLGQATMAMMLAATDLGIGTGHSAVGDQEAARCILFTALCQRLGIVQSMGRVGSCFDNAAAESWFSTLEWEVQSRHTFTDPDHARAVIVPWITDFYNHRRRHSSIRMMSPIDYENTTTVSSEAA